MLGALAVASVFALAVEAGSSQSQSLVPRTVFQSPYHSGCANTGPASCTNTSVVADTCCFEANGQLLQVQFWDSDPPTGPADSWTIHGLWPDYCVSGYPQNCDPARAYTNISAILRSQGAQDTLDFMNKYWKNQGASDESFWSHEWSKHGTCMTTMDHSCLPAGSPPGAEMVAFFDTVINLFQNLTTYDWLAGAGILPDSSKTWAYDDMVAALGAHYGFKPSLDCQSGAVFQVSYYYSLVGSVIDGIWLPKDAPAMGSCPSTGIKYLPKNFSTSTTSVPTSTATSTTTTISPTGTAPPNPLPTGAHFDAVTTTGAIVGGILSLGTWSTQTLATMHIAGTVDAFTITTSKGPCQVSAGVFSCSSSVTTPSTFTAVARQDGTLLLAYNNSTLFSSDKTPSGATVYPVYTDNQHAVVYQLAIDAFPAITTTTSATSTTSTSTTTSPPVTTTTTSSTVSTTSKTTITTATVTSTTATSTSSSSGASTSTTSSISTDTSTSTTTSSATITATASPSSTLASGWTVAYACATDTPSRVFKSPEYYHLTDNTPKTCTALCGSRGYALAGVEYADECFCAQDYVDSAAPIAAPASDCHMACAGDASQTCGAGYRVQVYASPSASTDAGTLPAGWSLAVPCAVDTSSRVFENAAMADLADNSPQRCISHCMTLGYSLAGVEYGSECFCGNAYRSGKVPAVAPTSQCQYACKGAPGLTCGGSWGIQVYSSA